MQQKHCLQYNPYPSLPYLLMNCIFNSGQLNSIEFNCEFLIKLTHMFQKGFYKIKKNHCQGRLYQRWYWCKKQVKIIHELILNISTKLLDVNLFKSLSISSWTTSEIFWCDSVGHLLFFQNCVWMDERKFNWSMWC